MRLDKFLLAMLCFSVFIIGAMLIWGDTVTNYNVTENVSDSFSGVYDTIDDTYDLSQDMKSHTLEGEIAGGDESWESMAKGSYSAIRMIKNSFTLVGDIIDAIAREVGVPSFFIKAAMTALTILILFAIIYLVFRYQNR